MNFGNISNADIRGLAAMKEIVSEENLEALQRTAGIVEESAEDLKAMQSADTSAVAMFKKAQPDKSLASRRSEIKVDKHSESVLVRQKFEGAANDFCKQNKQFTAKDLLDLIAQIETAKPKMTGAKVLAAVEEKYKDPGLVSKALEFLGEQITDPALKNEVKTLKATYDTHHAKEIATTSAIISTVAEVPREKLGTTSDELIGLHNWVKGAASFSDMFKELTQKYTYKQIIGISDYLRKSVGAELGANPNISPEDKAALTATMNEVKMLRILASLYRFANQSFPLLKKECQKEGENLPPQLTPETLAKWMVTIYTDRYVTGQKVIDSTAQLGVGHSLYMKMKVVELAGLAGIDQVPLAIFGSDPQQAQAQKDNVKRAIIEASEILNNDVQELEERMMEQA